MWSHGRVSNLLNSCVGCRVSGHARFQVAIVNAGPRLVRPSLFCRERDRYMPPDHAEDSWNRCEVEPAWTKSNARGSPDTLRAITATAVAMPHAANICRQPNCATIVQHHHVLS